MKGRFVKSEYQGVLEEMLGRLHPGILRLDRALVGPAMLTTVERLRAEGKLTTSGCAVAYRATCINGEEFTAWSFEEGMMWVNLTDPLEACGWRNAPAPERS